MPTLTIDNCPVDVPAGATILDAAAALGIDIPTLCYQGSCEPSTSCLVCLVKVMNNGTGGRLMPSCATPAVEGMRVESETAEVHAIRRSTLELLLSDHLGDCAAPCSFGCPAQMNIPQMLRQIAADDLRGAIATVKADIALPAVLGRICPAPCEKVCRRSGLEGSVTICQLKRFVADADLASPDTYLPPCRPASGKRVAIIGGGPSGLSAAYELAKSGHACTILDDNLMLGGQVARETSVAALPPEVLQAEVEQILRLGVAARLNTRVGRDVSMEELRRDFDAVLITCGSTALEQAGTFGLQPGPSGIPVTRRTFATATSGLFAAGNAIRGKGTAIRNVADGKEVAACIDQYLVGTPVKGASLPFTTRIGRMDHGELVQLSTGTNQLERQEAPEGYLSNAAREQAGRCLHCDCRAVTTCKLRKYSALYGADPRRYKSERRPYEVDHQHADVLFEPGKCIDCGLCIQITAAAGEELGLTYIGRGFDVRVGVPLGRTMSAALEKVAAQCVAACPTAAIAWKRDAASIGES